MVDKKKKRRDRSPPHTPPPPRIIPIFKIYINSDITKIRPWTPLQTNPSSNPLPGRKDFLNPPLLVDQGIGNVYNHVRNWWPFHTMDGGISYCPVGIVCMSISSIPRSCHIVLFYDPISCHLPPLSQTHWSSWSTLSNWPFVAVLNAFSSCYCDFSVDLMTPL